MERDSAKRRSAVGRRMAPRGPPANVVGHLEGKASLQEFLSTWTSIDAHEVHARLR
jgi:hypothetical protein